MEAFEFFIKRDRRFLRERLGSAKVDFRPKSFGENSR